MYREHDWKSLYRGVVLTAAFSLIGLRSETVCAQAFPPVQLQPSTPGFTQVGNVHLSGAILAGRFQGNGRLLTNVDAALLGGLRSDQYLRSDAPGLLTASQTGAILEVDGRNTTAPSTALYGVVLSPGGAAIVGDLQNGTSTTPGYGVFGRTNSPNGFAVFGYATNTGTGVWGTGLGGGVLGTSSHGHAGVTGASSNGSGSGVEGDADSGYGVSGVSASGIGVYGHSSTPGVASIFCDGDFSATGTKSFVIDHPLDPANKLLVHYCAEGDVPLDIYSGNTKTDDRGFATIALPAWVSSINRDFRYQLTVIDDGDDFVAVKVAREVKNNEFVIRTSMPSIEVSWELLGTRNDAWVQRHPPETEPVKEPGKRGTYLNPEFYGAPSSARMLAAPGSAVRRSGDSIEPPLH